MNANDTIIDVTPIEHSSSRGAAGATGRAQAHASSQSSHYQRPAWKTSSSNRGESDGRDRCGYGSAYTRFGDSTVSAKSAGDVFGGMAQIAVGAGLVLVGIPMLILPGPGLLAIGGGALLAANGLRKLLG